MTKSALYAVTLFALGFSAHGAFAAPVPYSDNFNGVGSTSQLNFAPPGWISDNGTVDWVKTGQYGITCYGGSNGCVDLDGTTNRAGLFETASTFHLLAGKTYELSAEVSGNQRGAAPDNLQFGFLKGTNLSGIQKASTVSSLASGSPFTLYTLFFTPTTNVSVRAFFYDVMGNNDQGPILDNVNVRQTAVPLPAAAWLMLSGLAALGAVARRRLSGTAAAD
jgi:hypothetical protein